MRQYHTELRETKETIKIICNRCGKEITVTKGLPEEEVLEVLFRERRTDGPL